MRFIREMIARKAAGDDQKHEDETLAAVQNAATVPPVPEPAVTTDESAIAGFEDEIEPQAVVSEANEVQAVAEIPTPVDAPAADENASAEQAVVEEDEYDEDAELEALDAAYPDLKDEAATDDKIDRLFPKEEAGAKRRGFC